MSETSLQSLIDERDDLLSSLEDLEREHAAGDVDDKSYAELHARYTARAAQALRAIEASELPQRQAPRHFSAWRVRLGRRRNRRLVLAVLVVCVVGLGTTLAITLSTPRLSGDQATGSVSVPASAQVRDELSEASIVGSEGQLSQAIQLYDAVLRQVPGQAVALTYKGWLERLAGLAAGSRRAVASGDALLRQAAHLAPGYSDARGLYGLALYEDQGNVTGALAQFSAFLDDRPSAKLLDALKAKMLAAYRELGRPAPRSLTS